MFRLAFILISGWSIVNIIESFSAHMVEVEDKLDISLDNTLLPFVAKMAKAVIILLTFVIMLSELGFDITGFIAGLGLGGLAFALAAKDAAANMFGGFVIISDKPFSIGDWIETPSVEGTVEDINIRSTRVRTFADALVTLPNATLANEPITNWTRMGRRRISFHLGVAYGTRHEKLQTCIGKIKSLLDNHEAVHPDTILVRFDRFSESSLDIFIYFFTKTTAWSEHLAVREEINLMIMQILEEEGVSIAFPSRSLYLEKME